MKVKATTRPPSLRYEEKFVRMVKTRHAAMLRLFGPGHGLLDDVWRNHCDCMKVVEALFRKANDELHTED